MLFFISLIEHELPSIFFRKMGVISYFKSYIHFIGSCGMFDVCMILVTSIF